MSKERTHFRPPEKGIAKVYSFSFYSNYKSKAFEEKGLINKPYFWSEQISLMKYQVNVEENEFLVEKNREGIRLDGKPSTYTIEKFPDRYLIYSETRVTTAYVVAKNNKELTLDINGKTVTVNVKDQTELLLEKLGMESSSEAIVNELIAPMPGVIMSILVIEGQEIKKGDPLLVLEAMKMENMIKSPTDGIISTISVKKGQSVEKSETLITFD